MAISGTLIGAVIMGGLLFTVFGALAFGRDWRDAGVTAYNPVSGWRRLAPGESLPTPDLLDRVSGRPIDVTFILLGVGVVIGAAVFAAALVLAADVSGLAVTLAVAGVGFLLAVYLVSGVYVSVRSRGHGSAAATAAIGITLGVLLLVAISVRLLVGA